MGCTTRAAQAAGIRGLTTDSAPSDSRMRARTSNPESRLIVSRGKQPSVAIRCESVEAVQLGRTPNDSI